jgi:hypothetical protein
MGAWLGRRTEPRVDYRESVRVIWPGEVSGVVARAVNLSTAGILVDAPTPTPCPVGSDVLCDLTLPRGPRLLRGRVAHRRLLPSAKVGMGIEFVDLSPREAAELRDVVGGSEPGGRRAPEKVKLRFAGTTQIVQARAFPTEEGFRLSTSLPFLKAETEVEIALSPELTARAKVAGVALERAQPGAAPRLLIDVRVDELDPRSSARTPVVEVIPEAVPEYVWEPDDLGAAAEAARAAVLVPFEPETVRTLVNANPPPPPLEDAHGGTPIARDADTDRTEIVGVARRRSPWRALGGGMLAGAIALVGFVGAFVWFKAVPAPVARPAVAPPTVVATPATPTPPAPVEALAPAVEPVPPDEQSAPAAPAAPAFAVGLEGSIASARRYQLRDPDGVAFNLPRAHATMKLGTYTPDVPGLKQVWIRALPGGGVNVRFFFTGGHAAPTVELHRDGVSVTPRE